MQPREASAIVNKKTGSGLVAFEVVLLGPEWYPTKDLYWSGGSVFDGHYEPEEVSEFNPHFALQAQNLPLRQ